MLRAMATAQVSKQQLELNRLKAISHPERAKILLILNEKTASPSELAREHGGDDRELTHDVREISRHCRMLEKLECIELVSTRPRRGATEHFYRATEFHLVEDDEWESLHPVQKDHFLADVVSAIFRDVDRSHQAGMLGSEPESEVLVRDPRVFDEEGLEKAAEIVRRARDELAEVEEESTGRLADTGEQGAIHAIILGLFETPPHD
jgi:DNA-binding transcriptional ArsR family regulator